MNATKEKRRVAGGASRAVTAEYLDAHRQLYGKPKPGRLPDNWRQCLPSPEAYYSRHVKRLSAPNSSGWAQGRCPFHEDHEASLSVHLAGERGGWKCFRGCGKGDMVSFHERLTGLKFPNSARDLLGLKVYP